MTFDQISNLASFLGKDYAKDILKMLQVYPNISASETASRLDMHIKTAQDFLEGMFNGGIALREEVYEKKRPYYRYGIASKNLNIDFDLSDLLQDVDVLDTEKKIKEKKDTGAVFTSSMKTNILSSVKIFTGQGRDKKERKIALSENQGKFLFFLPFPTENPSSIKSLITKSKLKLDNIYELNEIIEVLVRYDIIEIS